MRKKAIHALLTLAAFVAFAVMPAAASAVNDPEVTHPTGTLLKTGTLIEGTNIGNVLMTGGSENVTMGCTTATITGTLSKNDGSNVEATITGATFTGTGASGRCTASFGDATVTPFLEANGLPWCLRSTSTMATDAFEIRGNACNFAARPIRFILDIIFSSECVYERSGAVPGTFQTHTNDAVLSINQVSFTLIKGPFICPGEGRLDMSFTLETDGNNNALFIS